MRMRSLAATLLAGLTLTLAACGGSELAASTDSGAELLKPGALLYSETSSDPDSSQWEQVEELVLRFPDGRRWLAQLEQELRREGVSWDDDVKPALGQYVEVAAYAIAGKPEVVAVTKPADREKFLALVEKLGKREPVVTRTVGDWVALAESERVLDETLAGEGDRSLADDGGFTAALNDLPEDALSRVYVDPARLVDLAGAEGLRKLPLGGLDLAGAWLRAKQDGAELSGIVRGAGAKRLLGTPYASTLVEHVPADAIAFVTLDGTGLRAGLDSLRGNPLYSLGLRRFERESGIDADELMSLLEGEAAFFVRPRLPEPEFTLLLDSDDPERAKAQLEALVRRAGEEDDYTVATGEGVVALSTGRDPLAAGAKLPDSRTFDRALSAAGVPDEYTGLAWVDLRSAVRLFTIAMPGAAPSLEPLGSLVAFATADGDGAEASVFLQID